MTFPICVIKLKEENLSKKQKVPITFVISDYN